MLRVIGFFALAMLSLLATGCAEGGGGKKYSVSSSEKSSPAKEMFSEVEMAKSVTGLFETVNPNEGQDAGVGGEKEVATPRKIVYTAVMNLVVEDFEQARSRVAELVNQYGGFVANSRFQGTTGSTRSGNWTIRIPVKQYGDFLSAAADLGELESQNTTSREVTEEYYDVEARIRNKQREEERLLKHLQESTGKLEEILKVEHEISRVRGELERFQGRMRVLQDLTALTTVTLHIREIKNYVPAQAPTFLTRVSRTFDGTLESLLFSGQNLVLVIVAVGPWLVILGIPFGLLFTLIRRRRISYRKSLST